MDPTILKELQEMEKNNDFDNPKYSELLFKYYYTEHILRKAVGRMAGIH
jgi:proline iminopeptidase